jgi:hypothetical protein
VASPELQPAAKTSVSVNAIGIRARSIKIPVMLGPATTEQDHFFFAARRVRLLLGKSSAPVAV